MGAQLSVNLSVVSRSAFSYETPATIILRHFLVGFLPPLVTEDRGGVCGQPILYLCQWVRRQRAGVRQVQRDLQGAGFCGMKGTQVGRRPPKGNIFLFSFLDTFQTMLVQHRPVLPFRNSTDRREITGRCKECRIRLLLSHPPTPPLYMSPWPLGRTVAITAHHIRSDPNCRFASGKT